MERSEISVHQVRVFRYVKEAAGWVTAKEIAQGAEVAPRTARAHALWFVGSGIFEEAKVSPGHRYRFSRTARRNKAYLLRLNAAAAILEGVPSKSATGRS